MGIDIFIKPSGGTSSGGGGFLRIIKDIFSRLFSKKSFNGQNQVINKSTGQVVSCNELKTFINDEYNKYLQNPRDYQRNNYNQNQNMGGGYGDYSWSNNNGYGGDYGGVYGGGYGGFYNYGK